MKAWAFGSLLALVAAPDLSYPEKSQEFSALAVEARTRTRIGTIIGLGLAGLVLRMNEYRMKMKKGAADGNGNRRKKLNVKMKLKVAWKVGRRNVDKCATLESSSSRCLPLYMQRCFNFTMLSIDR